MWTIGWMWYSVNNQESALTIAMMLEYLSGALQMTHLLMNAIVPTNKEDMLTDIWESCNHIDKIIFLSVSERNN